ncbi:MAG: hypothetical protein ACI4NN_06460 [Pyramidobacter sp.]|jgi:hypothetical protein
MLLYSTTLKIRDTLTPDVFISLLVEWVQGSSYEENIIPGMEWHGERNARWGNSRLWLEISEYKSRNIIAARYEKRRDDGSVWDTDYVMNFDDMTMCIRLERSYTEDASPQNFYFSTPHFITLLIDGGFAADDGNLLVSKKPVQIMDSNVSILTDVINGRTHYRYPVVYVSKNYYDRDPVNVDLLCSRVKGAAHVFLQGSRRLGRRISDECGGLCEYNGYVGVYCPNGLHRRFIYASSDQSADENLLNCAANAVFQYMNAQSVPELSTWQGVRSALLLERLDRSEGDRTAAEELLADSDRRNAELQRKAEDLRELRKRVEELTSENRWLRAELSGSRKTELNQSSKKAVLYYGDEPEFFDGEIREMLLDAIEEKAKNLEAIRGSRRGDVLRDILEHNENQHVIEKRREELTNLFRGYRTLNSRTEQKLENLGFTVVSDNRHHKLVYYNDERYTSVIPTSGSDGGRGGLNNAKETIKKLF